MDVPNGPAAAAAAELSAPDLVARPRPAPRPRPGRRPAARVAARGRPVEPDLRAHRRHPPVGAAPPAAGPRARHGPRHAPGVPGARALAPTPVPVPRTVLEFPTRTCSAPRSTSWSRSTASSTGPPPTWPPRRRRRPPARSRVRGRPRRPARGRPGSGRPGRLRAPGRVPGPPGAQVDGAAGRVAVARGPGLRPARRPRRRHRARHAAGVDRARRLPAGQRDRGRRRPRSPLRGAGLGDGRSRRPARRPRAVRPLLAGLGRAGQPHRGDPGRPRLPVGRRADASATPSAPASTSPTTPGTRPSPASSSR